jgi:carboxypeptidase PM20D1
VKKILGALALAVLVLTAVVVVRTLAFTPREVEPVERVDVAVDAAGVTARLSEALQFRTISHQQPTPIDSAAFEQFQSFLEQTYPDVHGSLRRERIAGYSLLYTWPGQNPELEPILLTAHYDVVPIIPGTEGEWEHAPFGGVVAGGYVYGRGAQDDKSAVVALLEATTILLRTGFRPERTILMSFGHDEELGGDEGAAGVVAHLKERGIHLAWSLDEGSFLIDGIVPGLDQPAASINVAEKGYVSLDLVARGEGGHSSMPPDRTAVDVLAEALVALRDAPMPGGLDGLSDAMYEDMARHMSFGRRLLFANRWLFGGLLESFLADNPTANAMMRTTTAPTMLSASVKENVLPIEAIATVNFRVHPRDSVDGVVDHVRRAVAHDRLEVRLRQGSDASSVSSTESEGYAHIVLALRETYGDVIVAPGLTIGGTDSRHYGAIASDSYRFNPMVVTSDDISGFHGTNERISTDNLVRATAFYVQLMRHGGR